jgi:hypothetical protein
MLTFPQSVYSRAFVRGNPTNTLQPTESKAAVRLVQVVLAVYLLPALVLVLAVASVGWLVVSVVRLVEARGDQIDRS